MPRAPGHYGPNPIADKTVYGFQNGPAIGSQILEIPEQVVQGSEIDSVLAASVHESGGEGGVDLSVVGSNLLREDDRWAQERLAVGRGNWRR